MRSWGTTKERHEDFGLCHETDVECTERVALTQLACERLEAEGYLADARECGHDAVDSEAAAGCTEAARRHFISRVRSCTERS